MKIKLNKVALIAIIILSAAIAIKTGFIITDLFFSNKPLHYRFQTCPDIKVGVLWSTVTANIIILTSAYLIYTLFKRVVNKARWNSRDSGVLTVLFIINIFGFFISKLSSLIANDFLMEPSTIGCPLYSNMITSQYYIRNATIDSLFDPLFLIVVLCMALLSAFLKYSYGIKQENDSFI